MCANAPDGFELCEGQQPPSIDLFANRQTNGGQDQGASMMALM